MAKDTRQRHDTTEVPQEHAEEAAKQGGKFLPRLFGSIIGTIIAIVVIVAVAAYLLVAKIEKLNPFGSRTTISTTVVLGKLTKIEQVHVATRSYAVDVKITQSVGIIPCFLVCNQMELKGSGTDDAVVDHPPGGLVVAVRPDEGVEVQWASGHRPSLLSVFDRVGR